VSQRNSGCERRPLDNYPTPPWVTEVLLPHLPPKLTVWEPRCRNGNMCAVLRRAGYRVHSSDIASYEDFPRSAAPNGCNAVITSAPFRWARQFIEHALRIIEPHLVSSPCCYAWIMTPRAHDNTC
jgi:hypothetical protein